MPVKLSHIFYHIYKLWRSDRDWKLKNSYFSYKFLDVIIVSLNRVQQHSYVFCKAGTLDANLVRQPRLWSEAPRWFGMRPVRRTTQRTGLWWKQGWSTQHADLGLDRSLAYPDLRYICFRLMSHDCGCHSGESASPTAALQTTARHNNVSTSMFDGGRGVLGSIPPPNTTSWCQRARFWYHLTTTLSPRPPLNHSDVPWQTSNGPVHVLSVQGDLVGSAGF